jgi:pimeloyl-ACP methyl ester carboxylesterase
MLPAHEFSQPKRLPAFAVPGRNALLALGALLVMALGAGAAQDEGDKILPPEEVSLRTMDGVTLTAAFYPSKLNKKAVPVILLHASKGSRADFEELALDLQRAGHAVLAPDLRGHGADRAAQLRPEDYAAMGLDMEVLKKFLVAKNNAGELNIEKLCLVGVEMGALVAVNWAAQDWDWPVLAIGKQGQDVKALVLISPEWTFKGLRMQEAIAHPNVRSDLSIMIIAGKGNSKSLHEAKRLHNALERYHPMPPADEAVDKQMLWMWSPQTSLQGTRLLNEKTLRVDETILKFIDLRLVKKQMPWSDRKNPRE